MDNSTRHRWVSAAFGAFLVGMAIVTMVTADRSTRLGAMAVAIVLALLGVDAIISAARNRRSLISRLGPLP